MAGITLSTAQTHLDLWVQASEHTATGKAYTIGDRQLTKNDADEIIRMIEFWERRVAALTAAATARGGLRLGTIEPQ